MLQMFDSHKRGKNWQDGIITFISTEQNNNVIKHNTRYLSILFRNSFSVKLTKKNGIPNTMRQSLWYLEI